MSATPLSDAIARVLERDCWETYHQFLEVFMRSRVGVIVHGLPAGTSGTVQVQGSGVGCASVDTPDGRIMLLACADRAVFLTRFERRFNSEIDATELLGVVLANPSCQGIFINSARSEHSMAINRETVERLASATSPPPSRVAERRPWWKVW